MSDEWRQIKNAMTDLALGEPTLEGVLDALNDLHRLRHLYPPLLAREMKAVSALEKIAHHQDEVLGHVVNATKLGDALASIARDGLAPPSPE